MNIAQTPKPIHSKPYSKSCSSLIDIVSHLLLYQCKNFAEYPIEVKVKEVSLQQGFFYNNKGEKKHYKYTGIELFSKFPNEAYHHSLFLNYIF